MEFRSRPGSVLERFVVGFDLDEALPRLREAEEWQEGRRNAITLCKGGRSSVVVLGMRTGDRLEEHSGPGPVALSVGKGRFRFMAAGEAIEVDPETLLARGDGVRRSVEALGANICLLNVATGG